MPRFEGEFLRVLDTGAMQVDIQSGLVKMILSDSRYISSYISNLRDLCVLKPREVLKIEKMLSFINPVPKSRGRFNAPASRLKKSCLGRSA